ncbi:nitrate reductase associated protein [Thermosynechococcus sp. QKsg1]|uniref:nitrate reductase associated protein n=1 Tax=unclassified Thermosynechococcus TaxID=2622553 RepID=UPI00122EA4A2|nr:MULTISPECIES: nitrate reductase associated protein [unclassified Thermosynechococcus]MDR7921066.1 nitrate reductase associated protein [Thermosynechococcus sp. HY213]QEQ01552.1 nitrate reductase associated protein [Thermosynechococcus sp. CL-1]WJI25927.1 nitrate reductase associated protein [Thermosynechococcus sp. B1]WKT83038.1 nitrate reductase associated protein [Thermosynechococcus sp. HY596]WNC62165.1 nitrate reductase associated protein [Thermosynechococcus sp. HY591]
MSHFFEFEAEFTASLRCIPMIVRYKLDLCGVKLKLLHWHQLSQEQRQWLVVTPCDTPEAQADYRQQLRDWVTHTHGTPPSDIEIPQPYPWDITTELPETVQQQLIKVSHHSLTVEKWSALTPLQRFALVKLSQPGHENRNFWPALQEFGLA